jgi:hypothetical protein
MPNMSRLRSALSPHTHLLSMEAEERLTEAESHVVDEGTKPPITTHPRACTVGDRYHNGPSSSGSGSPSTAYKSMYKYEGHVNTMARVWGLQGCGFGRTSEGVVRRKQGGKGLRGKREVRGER